MSAEAVGVSLRAPITDMAAKMILITLADHHNITDGRCFPSVATIMKITSLSRPTVFRKLRDLEEAGYIRRNARFDENGRQTSTSYDLPFLDGALTVKWPESGGIKLRPSTVSHAETPLTLNKESKNYHAEQADKPLGGSGKKGKSSETGRNGARQSKLPALEGGGCEAADESEALSREGVKLYNDAAEKLGTVRCERLTSSRKQALKTMRAALGADGIDWRLVFARLATGVWPTRSGWTPRTIDEILMEKHFTALVEGAFEPKGTQKQQGFACVADMEAFRAKTRVKTWLDKGRRRWPEEWGPAPGMLGCQIAPEIFREFGVDANGDPLAESRNNGK